MRNKASNGNLEVYAVAGTHTVVLSFDYVNKPQGLLGFAVERKDLGTGKRIWLMGQKCFKTVIPDPVKGQQYPTHLHPVQSFMWKDFTVQPGSSYSFKITPVLGKPNQLQYGPPVEVTVTAEKEWDGKQGVYFNRGVSGSQSYSENFPKGKISDMDDATRERALTWLSRGLFEGLRDYIARAKPGEYLYGCFYEFKEDRTLGLLKEAKNRGVNVLLIADGKQYGDENLEAVRRVGITRLVKKWRTKAKIPHNKFLVHCSKTGKATKVWTGSTNISEKGIFGQCNTGHIITDAVVADKYLKFWNALLQDPTKATLVTEVMNLQADVTAGNLPDNSITAFFSPRDSLTMLDVYARLVETAGELACGIFPFNIDMRFQNAFNTPKNFPRYVIVDKGHNKFEPNDSDLDVAVGAAIKNPVDQWLAEKSSGSLFYGGTDYVHNKLLVIDPLGKNPVVVVGSANLSEPSTNANDENMLVIKGAGYRREMDIYLTEFIRLFDHFNFREWLNSPDGGTFKPFLEEAPAANGFSWVDKYFDNPEYLSYKRKIAFKNMII
ncbi:MAG TPA: phospholipase D-like domain-containing protein [Ferruginibacter sp.]|nr:phospholipase D-like domain-containing protein [Ferruginibacter sp.]